MVTIGDHIRKRRLDLGLTQRDVARATGAGIQTVSLWEQGRHLPEIRYWPGVIRFLGYDPHPEPTTFADKLLAARRRCGYSQVELARHLKVDPSSIWGWEVKRRQPRLRTVRRLEPILDDFLGSVD